MRTWNMDLQWVKEMKPRIGINEQWLGGLVFDLFLRYEERDDEQ